MQEECLAKSDPIWRARGSQLLEALVKIDQLLADVTPIM
jgi:hypothetical protein